MPTMNPNSAPSAMEFSIRTPAVLWGFMAVFLGFVAAMSWITLKSGPPPGYSVPVIAGVLGFFWMGGWIGWCHVAAHPCVRISLLNKGQLRLLLRYPFRRERHDFRAEDLLPAELVQTTDDEGDVYYQATICLQGKEDFSFNLAESHQKETVEAACACFNRWRESWDKGSH